MTIHVVTYCLRCNTNIGRTTEVTTTLYRPADQAEVTTLTVNNAHNTTTVNESDSISVTCTASGRPTAGIVLTRDGETVNSRPQGEVTRDAVATLTNVTSRARCEDAGHYTCQVHNDVAEPDLQTVTVFVNCKLALEMSRAVIILVLAKPPAQLVRAAAFWPNGLPEQL